jgi:dTDP-4-amino-4,6-dideoxygalactose transaminase
MTLSSLSAAPIPLVRLDADDPELMEELLLAVRRVASSSAFILGDEVAAFEAELAAYCGTAHAIGVNSGTDALLLTLLALGIGAGDEVIVPANTFIATAEAVALAGATTVVADVDPATGLVTAATLEPHLTGRTRAIAPVHLHGRTLDIDPILTLAAEQGVHVLEDACQAHGSRHRGRPAGSLGLAGCLSFYPAKNLGAWGDGGAILTSDDTLAEQVRLLRSHGESPRHHHRIVGTTSRLDAIQAAVLRVKLRRLEETNVARRSLAAAYDAALAELGDGALGLPAPLGEGEDHVYHQYVVRSDRRDELRDALAAEGIASAIHYPTPVHLQPAFASLGLGPGSRPVAESLAGRILSLPMFPAVPAEQRYVAERVAQAAAALTATP